MALWRVLDLYKRDASRRGQAPAKPTHLNSDKKVNSKPSETGRSPLNRLANRPVVLRSSAYFEFCAFYLFRVFFRSVLFRAVFPCAVFFYYRKNHFSVLFEYDFTPWKRQKNHAKPILTHSRFSSAYDIIVDVTTTSHFGTFRSHRCPCFCQFSVI